MTEPFYSTTILLERAYWCTMVQREYEFNYGEPGLFMEIYVAKKAEFQPLLHETLTAG